MTVKCLKEVDQAYIVDCFTAKTATINELATMFGRSRRTIIRVLEEHSIDPGIIPRGPRGPYKPRNQVQEEFQFPNHRVIPTRAPWYRRVLRFIGINVYA